MTTIDHWCLGAPRSVTHVDEELAEPGAGQVRVRLAYTALSPGSNVHVYLTGSYPGAPADSWEELLYMGSGIVEVVEEGVTSVAPGTRVVLQSTGHQSAIVVPEARMLPIPDGLSLRDASLSYLAGWSVSALHLGRYAAAETVAVVGLGLVGSSAAMVAELMGARVIGLDVDPDRAAFGRNLGLGAVAQVSTDDGAASIADFVGSRGVDLILETSGAWAGLREAVALARDYTRVAIMGIYRTPPLPDLGLALYGMLATYPAKFHYRRISFIGVGSDPDEVLPPNPSLATTRSNLAYVLEQAARGRLQLGRLVTDVLPPDQVGVALERLAARDTQMVGVVFDWGLERP